MSDEPHGYRATPELERELRRTGQVSLEGGRYRATVLTSGASYYEAYTDSLPFVYGRPAATPQGALDNLERAFAQAELASASASISYRYGKGER